MPRQAFPYTTFTNPSGDPLSNGYVLIRLSDDAQSPSGSVCGGYDFRVQLDSTGVMLAVPQVWPNASLLPLGTSYIVEAFTAEGESVFRESFTV